MTKSRGFLTALPMLVLAALLLGACNTQTTSQIQVMPVDGGGNYTNVSASDLSAMMADKDFQLINVHVPYKGEIPGTDLSIPFDAIEQGLDSLPVGKDTALVVYCRSGSMSAAAARALVQLGYTKVWNLDGGMIAWEQAGLPLQGR